MENRLLLLLIQTTIYRPVKGFTLDCPVHSQWNLRAKELCNVSDGYHCLYDVNKIQNIEACRNEPQLDAPGYKIQIVGSLEGVKCEIDRYQPFMFWTNGSTICKFEKSSCTEEGQLQFSLGTNKADSTCRCDYTKGYDFVIRPKNTCFCMPSAEDCSCFIRQCPNGLVLSPDYKCAPVAKLVSISQCPLTTSSVETTKTSILPTAVQDSKHDYYNEQFLNIVISVLVLLVIGTGIIYFFICECICQRKLHGFTMSATATSKYNGEMESWKDHLKQFVPTRASQKIVLAIAENPCVLITGPFGSGKTTLVCHIMEKLDKEGFEITLATSLEDIVRCNYGVQRKLFVIDDIFGKYSSNISGISDRSEKYVSAINDIKNKNDNVRILITSRTYIYQLHEECFKNLRKHLQYSHFNLIEEDIKLCLEERNRIYKSYFESDPPETISDYISLYNFFPLMCSSDDKDNIVENFKHPVEIISAEIAGMKRYSDNSYLALAILAVSNDKLEKKMLTCMKISEKTDIFLRDILNESGFNQYPSQHMLHLTFISLKGEFIKEDDINFSFLCTELFDVVASCVGGSFIDTILKHSSSIFIKEKLQLSPTYGNDCSHSHTITVPYDIHNIYYRRLISDMNNNFIFDVLSNELFQLPKNRVQFLVEVRKHVQTKTLVDAETDSNVLHISSLLGYSDFLRHFLQFDQHPDINKGNYLGKTPLHLACENQHLRCVECLLQYKPIIDKTDKKKRTAFHYACEAGDENIVKRLITCRNNATTNKKDNNGMTPLHIACDNGYKRIVEILVENNANVNTSDEKGRTPLHYAYEKSFGDIVNYLITKKAFVNKTDGDGSRPLHIVCKYGHEKKSKTVSEQ